MIYKSLHQYLDVALKDISHPTHSQIKEAKRAYWKLYYKHYRRQRRELKKEFTLGFGHEELQQIEGKRGSLSTSKYLYKTIEQSLGFEGAPLIDEKSLSIINQHLLELINLMEELLDNGASVLTEDILNRLEKLEQTITELKTPQYDN